MAKQSRLLVEGKDDLHTIHHLLSSHGIESELSPKPPPKGLIGIHEKHDVDKLLKSVHLEVSTNSGGIVGFVLDADTSPRDRWRDISVRLKEEGVDMPKKSPRGGFIGKSKYNSRVGVWIMPDNQHEGAIEHFLQSLISDNDQLLHHARNSTDVAKRDYGARFRPASTKKAVLHAWLAWQKRPGVPYGTAIKAEYFRNDSLLARDFVSWCRRLFELD